MGMQLEYVLDITVMQSKNFREGPRSSGKTVTLVHYQSSDLQYLVNSKSKQ
jgi:hypothetical protein